MKPKVKFRCKITEITNAIKKHGGVDNVVIENGEDVCGVINSLLGVIESHYIEADETRAEIIAVERNALIELSAVECLPFIDPSMSDAMEAVYIRKKFLEEVKELQSLIAS